MVHLGTHFNMFYDYCHLALLVKLFVAGSYVSNCLSVYVGRSVCELSIPRIMLFLGNTRHSHKPPETEETTVESLRMKITF
jgi:hypothetical protein